MKSAYFKHYTPKKVRRPCKDCGKPTPGIRCIPCQASFKNDAAARDPKPRWFTQYASPRVVAIVERIESGR